MKFLRDDAAEIDIIIPAYNPGLFFEGCLNSCLHQTYQGPYKIIIVDDASTEDLPLTISKCKNQSSKVEIKYIRLEENKGVAYARNLAIKNSFGRFIVFQDADDFMCPDRIETSVQAFFQDTALVMVCGNWRWIINGVLEEHPRFAEDHLIEYVTLLFDFPISSPTVAIKREILETTGLFDEKYVVAEDYDLWARILKNFPHGVKYIHKEMTHHNRHATDYSLTKKYMWTEHYYRIIEELKKKYRMV